MFQLLKLILAGLSLFLITSFISGDVTLKQYPDPQNGILKIITAYDLGESSDLKIFSSTGRMLIHEEINRNTLEIEVEKLSNGIYYGIIKNYHFTERFKFNKRN